MKMHLHVIAAVFVLLFANTACSDQLGGAKGSVQNALTGQPIAGAQVVATTSSNIESEQRYKQILTKTANDGSFAVKGLRNKSYSIKITKDGFTAGSSYATIPEKSNMLIEKPIRLLPLPQQGPGVYAYTDKYVKLTQSVPFGIFESKTQCCGFKNISVEAKDLNNIPPVRPAFLVMYGMNNSEINKMYFLFRHTAKENADQNPEEAGEYYTVGGYHSQFAETFASISLESCYNDKPEILRSGSDSNPLHFWGKFACAFSGDNVKVFRVSNIPNGYYFLGFGNRYHIKETMSSLVLNYQ